MSRNHRGKPHGKTLRFLILSVFGLLLMGLAGCAVGPNFRPPQPSLPSAWIGPPAAPGSPTTPTAEQDLAQWWRVYNDETLTSLVARSVNSNLDLRLAESRIRQAEAARGVAAAALWPNLNLTGTYTRARIPTLVPKSGASAAGGGTGSSTGGTLAKVPMKTVGVMRNMYQASLGAIWTLDIFGGSRRSVEAANADIQAAEEDRRDVLVTLVSEVALTYINLRGFQQQILIAKQNLEAQRHTVQVTRQRFQGGFVGALDVSNAEALTASTAAQIPTLETSAQQAIYSLSVLLGREPSALLPELSAISAIPPTPPTVPVGVPSDLLRRRPDIRRAEAQIHAATARVGVAVADLFPKLTLSGSVGLEGSRLKDLSNWVNHTWSVGPSLSVPLFEGGRVISNIQMQKALQEQSILTYEKTVLSALQDVENVLIAATKEQERRDALQQAAAANRKAVGLAKELYAEGETNFLSVLDAQRSLLASEDALIQSNRNISTNLVTLYKALGGGWTPESPE